MIGIARKNLAQFAPLASMTTAAFYSLQKGEPAAETIDPPPGMQLIDWTADLNDFADTAALIENLDLVIAVDTAAGILPARWEKRYGSCCRSFRIGGGC